jgi:hypothetical protein
MKNLMWAQKHRVPISILLLVAFFFTGCAALNEAQQRRQARVKQEQKERYLTFERPTSEITVSPDGLKVDSKHYTLTFAEDLLGHEDFDEPRERQDMGQGALLFMESLYDFVHSIFGFEPDRRMNVVLYQTFMGNTRTATTQINYQTIYHNGVPLKTVDRIQMNFPLEMFSQRDVRAHELTHAFTQIYQLPIWFAEGIAVFVQLEQVKGSGHTKIDIQRELRLDFDGINAVQNWAGHRDASPDIARWGYDYAYSIVSEVKARFGEDFYLRLFRLIEEDQLHQRLPNEMSTSMLIYYMSQAAGQDLVPFFEDLQFRIRRLTRAEILSTIRHATQ